MIPNASDKKARDAAFSRVHVAEMRPEGRVSKRVWTWKRLGEIGRITTGKTPNTTNAGYFGGDMPFITPGDFSDTPYITKTGRTLTASGAGKSRVFPAGTIYTVCIGATVGKVGVCPVRATCNQQINALEVASEYDAVFCYYAVRYHFNKGKRRLVETETLPLVNKKEYSQFSILVPPLSEQRRIATVLSACERVVEGKQKLLDAKKSRKRALLQALFDPKGGIRLSKFLGPWRSETLRGLGDFEKGHGITNSQCLLGECPCVKYGDIYVHYDTHFSEAQSHTTESVFDRSLLVKSGSMLFTCSGEDPLDIGKCVAYTGQEPIAVGGDILVFHPRRHDSLFLAYQQQTSALIKQKAALAKGQSVFHIHLPEIQGLKVFVPPTVEEERAIANTLLSADHEIDGLAREIEAWKQKRKALSQLLLSGKVRV